MSSDDRRLRGERMPHRITIRLDEHTYQELELEVDATRMSASEIGRQVLRKHLGLASVFDRASAPAVEQPTSDSGCSPEPGGDGKTEGEQ